MRIPVTVALILSWLIYSGCSDLNEPVESNLKPEISAHPVGWVNVNSGEFHGLFIRDIDWDLRNCQECHGVDYAGGIANSSCLPCHPKTPEDCIVCHGGVDNLTGAPPEDLEGNVVPTAHGVGAHTAHLEGDEFAAGFECHTCHAVPDSFYAPGHIGADSQAEVMFENLALADGAQPIWNSDAETCANSYCHGNWALAKEQSDFDNFYTGDEMTGNNASPVWTDPESVDCESCHNLPPTGHIPFELNVCTNCHSAVVDADGNIVDKTKHVNGQINVFGQERPIF